MAKYLDSTGLTHFGAKIKSYVATYITNLNLGGTYVAKEDGKGLSTNDYTTAEKDKLAGIAAGAEVNVQSDWNATSGDAMIKNKPTIPAAVTESTVSGWGFTKNTGTYSKPSTGIPKDDLASAVQSSLEKADTALQSFTESDPTVPSHVKGITTTDISNWNGKQAAISDLSDIRSGAALGATALQSYTETDPTVPAWAKATNKPTYTAAEVGALPDSTTIPTKVSDLTNDSGFTSNTGTITGITMNGASKGTSGVVNLGTVITAHQDISGKADVAALAGYTPTSGFATINGASITGGGNIVITAGSSSITTIDATPTSGSTNPVQSGGVYDAIEGGFYY